MLQFVYQKFDGQTSIDLNKCSEDEDLLNL